MIRVGLEQAEAQLGYLIDEATAGENVVIESGGSLVRLVALDQAPAKDLENSTPIAHDLDRYMGTWTAEQEAELLAAVEVFEYVDESFWA